MSFPRYPAYKPSGVEWLGEVPEHWDVLPCRAIVDERTEKNEGAACQDYLSLMANIGIIPYEEKGDIGNKKPEDLSKCKIVKKGDFVINSMNYGIGSYGVSSYDGVCSPVYIVLITREAVVEPGFAFRIFEDKRFQGLAQSFGNGILAHRCAIGWDILKGIGVAVPPRLEQVQILEFLDRETAKIDALIAEQQRLIELLQEKRQAVISHAVTKGQNPDAPMKDSGVEWLGEVPEHWEVAPLKYLSKIKAGFAFKSDEFIESGVPVLRISDIGRDGAVDFRDAKYLADEALDAHSDVLVKQGDIVMAMTGATIGKAAKYTAVEPALLNQRVCIFRARRPESQPYLWFVLATHYYAEHLNITAFGGAQPNISDSELVACHVPIPPVKEQVDIAVRLLEDMANIVVLETEAQQAISLLQELRSALISAAVTGQIDVRGLVPEADAS